MFHIISFAFMLIFVVIQLFIINYLLKLEKIGCECAMDWRRNFLIMFFIISVLYIILLPVVSMEVLPYIQAVYSVLGILNVVFVIQYVYRLKKEKCACSEALMREVMLVMAIIDAVIYSFALSLVIFVIFTVGKLASKVNTRANRFAPVKRSSKFTKSIRKVLKRK